MQHGVVPPPERPHPALHRRRAAPVHRLARRRPGAVRPVVVGHRRRRTALGARRRDRRRAARRRPGRAARGRRGPLAGGAGPPRAHARGQRRHRRLRHRPRRRPARRSRSPAACTPSTSTARPSVRALDVPGPVDRPAAVPRRHPHRLRLRPLAARRQRTTAPTTARWPSRRTTLEPLRASSTSSRPRSSTAAAASGGRPSSDAAARRARRRDAGAGVVDRRPGAPRAARPSRTATPPPARRTPTCRSSSCASTGRASTSPGTTPAYPYLVDVSWTPYGDPLLVVMTRDQHDAAGARGRPRHRARRGRRRAHRRRLGRRVPGATRWAPDGRLLTLRVDAETDTYRLHLGDGWLSPGGLQVRGVLDVDDDGVLVVDGAGPAARRARARRLGRRRSRPSAAGRAGRSDARAGGTDARWCRARSARSTSTTRVHLRPRRTHPVASHAERPVGHARRSR